MSDFSTEENVQMKSSNFHGSSEPLLICFISNCILYASKIYVYSVGDNAVTSTANIVYSTTDKSEKVLFLSLNIVLWPS